MPAYVLVTSQFYTSHLTESWGEKWSNVPHKPTGQQGEAVPWLEVWAGTSADQWLAAHLEPPVWTTEGRTGTPLEQGTAKVALRHDLGTLRRSDVAEPCAWVTWWGDSLSAGLWETSWGSGSGQSLSREERWEQASHLEFPPCRNRSNVRGHKKTAWMKWPNS